MRECRTLQVEKRLALMQAELLGPDSSMAPAAAEAADRERMLQRKTALMQQVWPTISFGPQLQRLWQLHCGCGSKWAGVTAKDGLCS